MTCHFYNHWHKKYKFQPFWPNFELGASLRETKNSKILRKWSPKRTAFFKSPLTFDNDLLITGDTCSSKMDPFYPILKKWGQEVDQYFKIWIINHKIVATKNVYVSKFRSFYFCLVAVCFFELALKKNCKMTLIL